VSEVIHNLASHTVGTPDGTPESGFYGTGSRKNAKKTAGAPRPRKVLREKKKFGREKLYQTLADLAIVVRSLYPQDATKNPFRRVIPFQDQAFETVWLFDQLVHSITLVNHLSRYRDREGHWISERGDVLAALHLMQNLLNPNLLLTPSEKDTVRIINQHMGQGIFTRHNVQQLTGLSKTHSSRQIGKLLQSGLIRIAGGHKNRGYRYQLCR
jgi:hypothetical protein